MHKIMRTKK